MSKSGVAQCVARRACWRQQGSAMTAALFRREALLATSEQQFGAPMGVPGGLGSLGIRG